MPLTPATSIPAMHRPLTRLAAVLPLAALFACGGAEKPATTDAPPAPPAAAVVTPVTPCATCKIIEVAMITDATGSYFKPKNFEAHEGDVLRFKLVIGVHNANFLADSNKNVANLPKPSDMLQLPGQTVDIAMNFGTGRFFFQCDPHAALGMVGRVKVEKKEREER